MNLGLLLLLICVVIMTFCTLLMCAVYLHGIHSDLRWWRRQSDPDAKETNTFFKDWAWVLLITVIGTIWFGFLFTHCGLV